MQSHSFTTATTKMQGLLFPSWHWFGTEACRLVVLFAVAHSMKQHLSTAGEEGLTTPIPPSRLHLPWSPLSGIKYCNEVCFSLAPNPIFGLPDSLKSLFLFLFFFAIMPHTASCLLSFLSGFSASFSHNQICLSMYLFSGGWLLLMLSHLKV